MQGTIRSSGRSVEPVGTRKVGCCSRESKHLRVFAGLQRQLGAPGRAFRGRLPEVNCPHVYVPFIHVESGTAASEQVIRWVVEVLQVTEIQEPAILPTLDPMDVQPMRQMAPAVRRLFALQERPEIRIDRLPDRAAAKTLQAEVSSAASAIYSGCSVSTSCLETWSVLGNPRL